MSAPTRTLAQPLRFLLTILIGLMLSALLFMTIHRGEVTQAYMKQQQCKLDNPELNPAEDALYRCKAGVMNYRELSQAASEQYQFTSPDVK